MEDKEPTGKSFARFVADDTASGLKDAMKNDELLRKFAKMKDMTPEEFWVWMFESLELEALRKGPGKDCPNDCTFASFSQGALEETEMQRWIIHTRDCQYCGAMLTSLIDEEEKDSFTIESNRRTERVLDRVQEALAEKILEMMRDKPS